MNLSLYIASRYLFSKKKNSAINIVSMICAAGVCVGTMALVCVLSVYNGFQNLIGGTFNAFDPDLKIALVQGKTFSGNSPEIQKAKKMPCISAYTEVMEDNALLKYDEKQVTVTLKGVEDSYKEMMRADTLMHEGQFVLQRESKTYIVPGWALAMKLGASIYVPKTFSIYAPRHDAKVNLANPESAFSQEDIVMAGIYSVGQEETDMRYVFVPIGLARELYGYSKDFCTSIELKVAAGTEIESAKQQIKAVVGNQYTVKDQREQHEDFYKMLKIEKWITFLILTFILLIAVFNVIGSLTMLILEKEGDINTLSSLGATNKQIRQIFMAEGWLISATGAAAGTFLGLLLCFLQIEFGLIRLGEDGEFMVNAYPVAVEFTDIIAILFTVLLLGLLIAWYPTRYIKTDFNKEKE